MALMLMSYWSLEIALALVGLGLAAYALSFYAPRRRLMGRIGAGLASAAGVLVAQMAITVAVAVDLARRFSADVAIPMTAVTALEVVGLALLVWTIRQ